MLRIYRGVILGAPGFGKTWLLRYEALQRAKEGIEKINNGVDVKDIPLPIFFRLADLAREDKRIDEATISLLKEHYYVSGDFQELVKEKIKNGTCLILLDALDEVPNMPFKDEPHLSERAMIFDRLSAFAQNSPCKILLTSRIASYTGTPFRLAGNEREREMELIAFNEEQTKDFISAWFKNEPSRKDELISKISSIPQLRGLSQIPLLLLFVCMLYSKREELPTTRLEFYRECIDDFLREEWKTSPRPQLEGYIDAKKELLEYLAYGFFIQGKEQFYTGELRKRIEPYINKLLRASPLYGKRSDSLNIEIFRQNDCRKHREEYRVS